MDCYNFNTFSGLFPTSATSWYRSGSTAFFHCVSTGHYWRNSQITELSLLYEGHTGIWTKKMWVSEKESDEYDILEVFAEALSSFETIVGFNSNSFHIPYLEQKYKAYGLLSPFTHKTHIDLLKKISPIGTMLHISTQLQNLRIFFNLPDDWWEIECIAASCALYSFEKILNGAFSVIKAELLDGKLLLTCQTEIPFPKDLRIRDDEFYLIGCGTDMKVHVKLYKGRLRLYYKNHKEYYYLPEEDMAIHRSLAAALPKEKKEKATAKTCYGYIPYTEKLSGSYAMLKQYLTTLLTH